MIVENYRIDTLYVVLISIWIFVEIWHFVRCINRLFLFCDVIEIGMKVLLVLLLIMIQVVDIVMVHLLGRSRVSFRIIQDRQLLLLVIVNPSFDLILDVVPSIFDIFDIVIFLYIVCNVKVITLHFSEIQFILQFFNIDLIHNTNPYILT